MAFQLTILISLLPFIHTLPFILTFSFKMNLFFLISIIYFLQRKNLIAAPNFEVSYLQFLILKVALL